MALSDFTEFSLMFATLLFVYVCSWLFPIFLLVLLCVLDLMELTSGRKKRACKVTEITLLSDDELGQIVKWITDPNDLKSFSEVCKQWCKVEGLHRSSLRLLRHDDLHHVLPRFPYLTTFKTSVLFSNDDLDFLVQTCPRLEFINLRDSEAQEPLPPFLESTEFDALEESGPKLVLRTRRFDLVTLHVMPNLTHLEIGCNILLYDEVLEDIASSSLRYLNLEYCDHVTDRGLGFLANGPCSKTLKTLVVAGCLKITNAGVSLLQNMFSLEKLNLSWCGLDVTHAGVAPVVSKVKTLKTVAMSGLVHVTDGTIVALAENCLELEKLELTGCQGLTGSGIARAFSNHKSLKCLVLGYVDATKSDLDKLMVACPSLKDLMVDEQKSAFVGVRF